MYCETAFFGLLLRLFTLLLLSISHNNRYLLL